MKNNVIGIFVKTAISHPIVEEFRQGLSERIASIGSYKFVNTPNWGSVSEGIVNRLRSSRRVIILNGVFSPVVKFNNIVAALKEGDMIRLKLSAVLEEEYPDDSLGVADIDRLWESADSETMTAESDARQKILTTLLSGTRFPVLLDYDLPEVTDLRALVAHTDSYILTWLPDPDQFMLTVLKLCRHWCLDRESQFNYKLASIIVRMLQMYVSVFERSQGLYGKYSVAIDVRSVDDNVVVGFLSPQMFQEKILKLVDPGFYEGFALGNGWEGVATAMSTELGLTGEEADQ